jgi:hypothetical protein
MSPVSATEKEKVYFIEGSKYYKYYKTIPDVVKAAKGRGYTNYIFKDKDK